MLTEETIIPAQITIQQSLQHATRRLADAGIKSARLDAEVLLRHVLDIDRTRLLMRYPDPLPESTVTAFSELIRKRLDGAPVAYLTGTREFMALPFRVAPGVLIPRPDTEALVEWALAWLRDRPDARIVDIGTGSGAIPVSLAAHLPSSFSGEIIATDISPAALAIARDNANSLLPPERRAWVTFREGSLTDPLDAPVDLLLANLPYLTPAQIAANPDLDAEPRLALDGGDDGLHLVRRVVADLPRLLTNDGAAGFELDPSQVEVTASLLLEALPGADIQLIKDLAQFSRHIVLARQ